MNDSPTADARGVIVDCLLEIAPEIDPGELDDAAPLAAGLDLDSMDLLALLTSVEERTGCTIPTERFGAGGTLADLVALVAASADDAPG